MLPRIIPEVKAFVSPPKIPEPVEMIVWLLSEAEVWFCCIVTDIKISGKYLVAFFGGIYKPGWSVVNGGKMGY
ncbi:MAG: hypothetical protein NTW49_11110 [Bacteroidia bacterium]|nr:hypothetical protein [Bacteroidia bacterium]